MAISQITGDSIAANTIVVADIGPIDHLNSGTGNTFYIQSNNTTALFIDTNQSVGIGTSSPSAKLSIAGNITQNGTLAAWNSPITVFQQSVASFWCNGPTTVIGHNVLYGTGYATTRIGTGYSSTIGFNMDGAGSMDFTNYGTGTAGGAASSSIAMRIDSSGNVGIGTSSPASKLNIVSATNNGILLSDGTVTTLLYNTSSSSGSVGTQSNHPFNIYSNNAVRMSFDTSGNAIIGNLNAANNTLRYLDIQNTDTGVNAGVIMRFITNNAANSAVTTVDVVKYRTGGFVISNGDTATSNFTSFNVGGSERMRIDSSGRVTMPYQPVFYAYRTTSWTTVPGVVILDNTTINIGSCYNASTGRFTAPVAGTYQFTVYTMAYTTTNNYNDNYLRKNGSVLTGCWLRTYYASTAGSVSSMVCYATLSVNDYVDFYVSNGPALYSDSNAWIRFGGHLIG